MMRAGLVFCAAAVAVLLLGSGCMQQSGEEYTCFDGTKVDDRDKCPPPPVKNNTPAEMINEVIDTHYVNICKQCLEPYMIGYNAETTGACEKYPLGKMMHVNDYCLIGVVHATGDEKICESLPDHRIWTYGECVAAAAAKKDDSSLCDKIGENPKELDEYIIYSRENICHLEYAKRKLKSTLCYNVKGASYQNNCMAAIEESKKHITEVLRKELEK